jgi:hypothetical protein
MIKTIKMLAVLSMLASMAPALSLAQTTPSRPLEQRIARADTSKYRNMKAVHDGPGALDYRPLFDAETLESDLFFMHRGVIEPKSGIGAHFHNQCEEMFIILDRRGAVHHRWAHVCAEGAGGRSHAPGPLACYL